MFTPSTPAGGPLPVTPVDLARLDIGELSRPVAGMRSICKRSFSIPGTLWASTKYLLLNDQRRSSTGADMART